MTEIFATEACEPSRSVKRERLRILNACGFCRTRKVKCDGGRPSCQGCKSRSKKCLYDDTSTPSNNGRAVIRKLAPAPSSVLPSPPGEPTSIHVTQNQGKCVASLTNTSDSQAGGTYYTTYDRFTGDVTTTINAKAGTVSTAASNLVPFVNAPLFGQLNLTQPSAVFPKSNRSILDHLVDLYWRHVDPVEPVLDRAWFFDKYNSFHSNSANVSSIWTSIVNLMCALAIQIQESIPQKERDDNANHYFNRAWTLLRPEEVLWGSESIELVYCLVLMNRYLHCTNNQNKTWMTAGLAVRMAQSMSCHSQKASDSKETRIKRKLWATCVALDRCVSWSLGSIASASIFSAWDSRDDHAFTRDMELYEIGNQIQLAQIQSRSSALSRSALSHPYQESEYAAQAIQLDACLDRWENELPADYSMEALADRDAEAKPTRYLLHLRLLHTRIVLYRPMLCRMYSERASLSSLSGRFTKEGAIKCLETAQKIVRVVLSSMNPDVAIGILPWWYRIYYLHMAGTHFLAAMCTSDLYADSIAESWHTVLSALRSHEHLSEYVKQCVATFESLSVKILQARCGNPNVDSLTDAPVPLAFDDIFQEMGIDFNQFLFSQDDTFSNII